MGSAALQVLAGNHAIDSSAAKVSSLTDEQTSQLRALMAMNAPASEISKLLDDRVVETARGESKTVDEIIEASKQPGIQGKFTLATLGMPPVRPPISYVGVKPSLKQVFLPDDKKNLLLPSMFNPDPDETESDRLYKSSLSLTTAFHQYIYYVYFQSRYWWNADLEF